MDHPFIGRMIPPHYQIEQSLGSGGFGAVFLGRDLRFNQPVAIKFLLEDHFKNNPDQRIRFIREAKFLEKLNHPNIVKLFASGVTEDGQLYIVMEYISGQSLYDLMERLLQPAVIVNIAIQVCDALALAHNQMVIHRDLKPENIFIISTPQNPYWVKLIDFGIAKMVTASAKSSSQAARTIHEKLTMDGFGIGTLSYMSPDEVLGQNVDHRADIYSLGVILYELLAGQRPFQGTNPIEAMKKALLENPRPIKAVASPPRRKIIPDRLEALVLQCLEKNPEKRPQSMMELRNRLIETLAHLQSTDLGKRSLIILVGVIAAIILLLLLVTGLYYLVTA